MAAMIPELFCGEKGSGASGSSATSLFLNGFAGAHYVTVNSFPRASIDMSILQDRRVLEKMLDLQLSTLPSDKYLTEHGTDILPKMRKIVTNWMLEVCDEQRCEDQVFLVAVNLLDRFLNTIRVKRSQLQLSACVCLLLASKLRQSSYLSVELLVDYTDESVTQEEITQWELLVVSKLKWDLCPITPIDFVDVLLQQIHLPNATTVRKHAATLIALAATERKFICTPPSSIAGAAITASVQGLKHSSLTSVSPVLDELSRKLETPIDTLTPIIYAIEDSVQKASSGYNDATDINGNGTGNQQQYTKLKEIMNHDEEMMSLDGKETPVDVFDIHL